MNNREYWLWLTNLRHIYSPQITALLEKFEGVREIYEADYSDYLGIEHIGKKEIASLCDKNMQSSAKISDRLERMGAHTLCIDDEFYPDALRNLYQPPYVLYVYGERLNWNEVFAVSVVGSRKCTDYGIANTRRICTELAHEGVVIVSGMAKGIDTEAHRSALEAGVKTVAFLGCGIDIVYPPENKELMDAIAKNGAVMSEFPLGTGPYAKNFPIRNRLIAAFSRGTLVVEADEASGSLITAGYALENGKDVFAIPGDVGRAMSIGCNSLIKSGGAKLTENADDILSEYEYELANSPNIKNTISEPIFVRSGEIKISEYTATADTKSKKASITDARYDGLDKDSLAVIETLTDGERHIDEICRLTEMKVADVSSLLMLLELEGYVNALAGKRFELNL